MTPPAALPTYARLFLALWPAPGENEVLVRYLRQWSWPGRASLVRRDRLHLTLHFIGPVDRQRLAEVSAGLQVPIEPFALTLRKAEIWPRGIAVLQAAEVPEELTRLHTHLAEALQALHLPVEARRFRPHVTLARRAAGAVPPLDTPPQHWRVGGYLLVESLPGVGNGYPTMMAFGSHPGS